MTTRKGFSKEDELNILRQIDLDLASEISVDTEIGEVVPPILDGLAEKLRGIPLYDYAAKTLFIKSCGFCGAGGVAGRSPGLSIMFMGCVVP